MLFLPLSMKNLNEITLASAAPGVELKIVGFKTDEFPAKFFEMGILPDKEVKIIRKGFFNDPILMQVSGSQIAIRKREAEAILVNALNR